MPPPERRPTFEHLVDVDKERNTKGQRHASLFDAVAGM